MKKIVLVILLILVVACQSRKSEELIDENLKFRVDSLYEHTKIMAESSTPEVLDKICLDMTQMKELDTLTTEEKIIQMTNAFNVTLSGNPENQVKLLEARMAKMMDYWNEAQEEDAKRRCY